MAVWFSLPEPLWPEGWRLERPLGLALLLLPLVLWLVARLRSRPVPRATGTLGWWDRIDVPARPSGARRRRGTPLSTLLAMVALVAGSGALAGPRRELPELPRRWQLVIDVSPSMGLPAPDRTRTTRLAAAVERARERLGELAGARDRVLWRRRGRAPLELALEAAPPEDWLALERWEQAAPAWERFDEPGTIWVTDQAPDRAPRRAGLVAVGARPEPGPIAATGDGWVLWDGRETRLESSAETGREVAWRAPDAPAGSGPSLVGLFRIWAQERGLAFTGDLERASLVLEIAAPGAHPVRWGGGRERWFVEGPGPAAGVAADGLAGPVERWLEGVDDQGRSAPLVLFAPGRVRVAWSELAEIRGDPAQVALSFSRLFEAALLPRAGVVSLEERRARADAATRAPEPPVTMRAASLARGALGGQAIDAWLAAAAGVLALLAAALGPGRARARMA